ncbi:MAG: class I SAM-dependent methyltransferase [Bacteroidales bacterium]|nr:class I SAM-dependent methyltransferase [Bacteroidales bacterium]MDD3858769.1 class I SAM-dependent methyltransferase [Bacteroidales bacterium]
MDSPIFNLTCPNNWTDYELIDSGNFEKLERFGPYFICRPEPQAIWGKTMPESYWKNETHSKFVMDTEIYNGEKGKWINFKKIPEQWEIKYDYKEMHIRFKLKFNTFKHIGIFPEQAENWNYIYDTITNQYCKDYNILNLFAYTGGASIAARSVNAKVVHVDSVKPVINWANENMHISSLNDIHWVVEDAVKFVKRELKRENKYNGIILDPPAFGRGPQGEKWILEKNLNDLISDCSQLLKETNSFFILNLYSLGWSAIIMENLIKNHFPKAHYEFGESYIKDRYDKKLPLGTYIRFRC